MNWFKRVRRTVGLIFLSNNSRGVSKLKLTPLDMTGYVATPPEVDGGVLHISR